MKSNVDNQLRHLHENHTGGALTCTEIAEHVDLSPQRIGQIERQALSKMERLLRKEPEFLSLSVKSDTLER